MHFFNEFQGFRVLRLFLFTYFGYRKLFLQSRYGKKWPENLKTLRPMPKNRLMLCVLICYLNSEQKTLVLGIEPLKIAQDIRLLMSKCWNGKWMKFNPCSGFSKQNCIIFFFVFFGKNFLTIPVLTVFAEKIWKQTRGRLAQR